MRGEKPLWASRLAVNFAVLSGGELISKLFAIIAFAYLARVLGPQGFGYLEFTLAVIFVFTLLVDCGLGPYGAREVAKDKGAVAYFTVHIILIRSLLAIGTFTLLAIVTIVVAQPWPVKKLLLLYGLTLLGLPGLLPGVFQGRDLMPCVAVASILRWAIFTGGVLLFMRTPEQIWLVPLIETIAIGSAVVFYLRAFSYYFGSLRQRINYTFGFSMFCQALPIGASELVWAVKMYFATVLLGILIGGSAVGWFAAAHRIVVSLHTFVWLYFCNLLPSIARCTQGPLEALHRLMRASMQVVAWVAIFLGIAGTAFAEPIIALVYGPQYREAAGVLRVLIWLIPITLMSGHYRYVLIAYDKQRLEFLSTACGASVNILLNLVLVPSYGSLGAAWVLLISEALIGGLAYYYVYRTIACISPWPHIPQPLLAGAILTGALYFLPPLNIWIAGGSAVAVYCLVLFMVQPQIVTTARSLFLWNR